MNNKILARIVAVVLAVMMLGTVSFAAEAGLADGVITSTFGEDADYTNQTTKTMLAYKAATADAGLTNDNQIIAIAQGADDAVLSVDVAAVDTDYVKVVYGGNNGVTRTATIDLRTSVDMETITSFTVENVEVDGTTFTNVIKVTFTFEGVEDKTINEVGVKFYGAHDGNKYTKGAKVSDTANIAGGGSVDYEAYLFGVTAEDIEADELIAVPYVNFAE